MPIHDWTRVDAGIFHAFHHEWITELSRAESRHFARQLLCMRCPEQHAAVFCPDVLALQLPLEPTYQTAFEAVPRQWRRVMEPM